MTPEVEARIIAILNDSIAREAGAVALTSDTRLVDGGLALDSVSLLELVVAVEEAFGVTIEDSELTLDLLGTIGSLAGFIEGKLRGRGPMPAA